MERGQHKRRRFDRKGCIDELHAPDDPGVHTGFKSPSELFSWPDRAFDVLISDLSKPRVQRLRALAEEGCSVFSYMSGKGTDATCFTYLNRILQKYNIYPTTHGTGSAPTPFVVAHVCDQAEECIETLCCLAYGQNKVARHVFGELRGRFSEEVLATTKRMLDAAPKASHNVEQRVAQFETIQAYLKQACADGALYTKDKSDVCHQCRSRCA
eukprot:6998386-Pyramimonas_sp.AAC.1